MLRLHRCSPQLYQGESLSSLRKGDQTPFPYHSFPASHPCYSALSSTSLRPYDLDHINNSARQTKDALPTIMISFPLQPYDRSTIQTAPGHLRALLSAPLVAHSSQPVHGMILCSLSIISKSHHRCEPYQIGARVTTIFISMLPGPVQNKPFT